MSGNTSSRCARTVALIALSAGLIGIGGCGISSSGGGSSSGGNGGGGNGGGGNGGGGGTGVISVSVAPASQNVQANIGTQAFTATVSNDPQNKGVTWALSGTGCSGASCGTLSASSSASGTPVTYSAPSSVPSPSTVTLTAVSVAETSRTGIATITVTPPVSVAVSPSTPTVPVGVTIPITANVSNDPKGAGVTWSFSGCSGGACGTLSSTSSGSGTPITYSAPANIPTPAAFTLTATSVTDPAQSGVVTITVGASLSVTVSAVNPLNSFQQPPPTQRQFLPQGIAQIGQTQMFLATVQNDSTNAVTWAVSGAGCSGNTCGTLSSTTTNPVTYTAPSSITANPTVFTITATSTIDKSVTGSIAMIVSNGIPSALGWYEIPNTAIEPICPNPSPGGAIGCEGVIAAWGGGTADVGTTGSPRSRLLFMGGGHQNYWGNEVYALDLAAHPIGVNRLTNPTQTISSILQAQTCAQDVEDWGTASGGSPAPGARETYDGLAYISDLDGMWLFGGAMAPTGCASTGVWNLDLSGSSPKWVEKDPTKGAQETSGTDVNYVEYDPGTKLVYRYLANADIFVSYDPVTNTTTQLQSGQAHGTARIRATGVLDPVRHIFLIMGNSFAGWFDLNQNPPVLVDASTNVGINTECGTFIDAFNKQSLEDVNSPGLAYDPVVDRIIGWAGGNTVYVINTTLTTAATPSVSCNALSPQAPKNNGYTGGPPQTLNPNAQPPGPTGAQYNGTFGRFRYFPGLDVFVVVNDWQQNAFTFRLPATLPPLF